MKYRIDLPCDEDWEGMKPSEKGRFCDTCTKEVVDFSNQSKASTLFYLLENQGKSICGRLPQQELSWSDQDWPALLNHVHLSSGKKAFLHISLISMLLMGCQDNEPKAIQTPNPQSSEKIISTDSTPELDTLNQKPLKGKVKKGKKKVVLEPEIMVVGEIRAPEPPYLGGIEVPEPPTVSPEVQSEEILTWAEVMPEFPGGIEAMMEFIKKHLEYPATAKELGIQGVVYLRFVVSKDGTIYQFEVLKNTTNERAFEAEAMRVVRLMPNWIPGQNKGQKVSVFMTLPIRFRLD